MTDPIGRPRVIAATLAVMVLLVAQASTGALAQRTPVTLRIQTTDDLINVDSAYISQAGDYWLAANLFNGLVSYKPGTTVVQPDLAQRWTISPDGRVYTFSLRHGVKFHRGYGELTSADIKFSLLRHLDPATASLQRSILESIEKVETPDAYTVQIVLRHPAASFLGTLSWVPGWITSAKAARELGKQLSFQPVGTGPFYLDAWTKGQEIVLNRFDQYFAGPSKIDKLVFRVIKEELIGLLAFSRGELDVVPIRQLAAYKAIRGHEQSFNLIHVKPSGYYLLYLNNTKAPFKDVRVRRALSEALDRAAMYRAVAGVVEASPSVFNPLTFGYTRKLPYYDNSLAKAKQDLADAGFPAGFKLKINFTQSYLYEEFATMVKEQWAKLGLDATLEAVDRALISKVRREHTFDAVPGTLTLFEPEQHLAFYRTGSSQNYTGYSNPAVDSLADQASEQMNPDKRRAILEEIQRRIAEDVPVIPLGSYETFVVTRKNITGIVAPLYEGMVNYYHVEVH